MNKKYFKIIAIVLSIFLTMYFLLLLLSKIGWFSLGMNKKEYPKIPNELEKIQNKLYSQKIIEDIIIYSDDNLWILNKKECDKTQRYKTNFDVNLGEIKLAKYKNSSSINNLTDSLSKEIMKNISSKKCFDSIIIEYYYFDSPKNKSYSNFKKSYLIN